MATNKEIETVKQLYPLLYFACHGSHQRDDGLTERDLRILHHINGSSGLFASDLARHLGLARSTLSEALADLEARQLICRQAVPDSRRKALSLSDTGTGALLSNDGLSGKAIGEVLDRLTVDGRQSVISGLQLLADAVRDHEN